MTIALGAWVAGCGQPATAGTVEDEGDATVWTLDGAALSPEGRLAVEAGAPERIYAFPSFDPGRAFDRVGLRWRGTPGASIEIAAGVDARALGAFAPATVVFAEDGGFDGYVDVPAGARAAQFRVRLPAGESLEAVALDFFRIEDTREDGIAVDPVTLHPADGSDPADAAAVDAEMQEDDALGADAIAASSMPVVRSRAYWGARAPRCIAFTSPYRATFHHTVSHNGLFGSAARSEVRGIQAYHMDVRGYCDIAYQLLVDAKGVAWRGRYSRWLGAHTLSNNTGNIGVAYIGTFTTVKPGTAQFTGMAKTMAWQTSRFGIRVDGIHIRGHRQWPGQSTECPGRSLEQKASLLAKIKALRAAVTGFAPAAEDSGASGDLGSLDDYVPRAIDGD